MKNLISVKNTAIIMITILALVILFHLLVIAGIIPFEIVWGVRLQDTSQMVTFELFSVGINILMILVVANTTGFLKWRIHKMVIRIGLWLMFGFFVLTTIVDQLAKNIP